MTVQTADDFFAVLDEGPETVQIALGPDDVMDVGIKRLSTAECALLFQTNAALKWLEKYPDFHHRRQPAAPPVDETIQAGELLETVDETLPDEQPPRVQDKVWDRARFLIDICEGATGAADQINHVWHGVCDADGKQLFRTSDDVKRLADDVPHAEITKIYQAVLKSYAKAREVEKHIKNSEPEPLTGA